mgnify:CR=1 FL=1
MSSGTKKMSKTCLVVGNGPSLAQIPDEFLKQYPTFGSNHCYTRFVPSYYACVDPRNLVSRATDIGNLSCMKFIVNHMAHFVRGSVPLISEPHRGAFSTNALAWFNGGHTATFVLLQLAYCYGFERVGLIGVDHRYTPSSDGKDRNHFTENYYREGETWEIPDLSKREVSYRVAKEMFEKDGREIINITPNSALDIFPKENWEDWCIG